MSAADSAGGDMVLTEGEEEEEASAVLSVGTKVSSDLEGTLTLSTVASCTAPGGLERASANTLLSPLT